MQCLELGFHVEELDVGCRCVLNLKDHRERVRNPELVQVRDARSARAEQRRKGHARMQALGQARDAGTRDVRVALRDVHSALCEQ
eukprot:7090108-Prymnesium_polylepis.2